MQSSQNPMEETFRKTRDLIQPLPGLRKAKKEEMARTVEYGDRSFFSLRILRFPRRFSLLVCIHTGGATVHEAEEKRAALGEQYRDGHWPSSSFFILSQRLPSSRSLFSPPLSTECFKNLDLTNIRESFRRHAVLAIPFLNFLIL